jgi:hypothetical protein
MDLDDKRELLSDAETLWLYVVLGPTYRRSCTGRTR